MLRSIFFDQHVFAMIETMVLISFISDTLFITDRASTLFAEYSVSKSVVKICRIPMSNLILHL